MSLIEDEFKKRFDGKKSLEGINENELWNKISDSLDNPIVSSEEKRKKNRGILFFFIIGGLLCISLGTLFIVNKEGEIGNSISKNAANNNTINEQIKFNTTKSTNIPESNNKLPDGKNIEHQNNPLEQTKTSINKEKIDTDNSFNVNKSAIAKSNNISNDYEINIPSRVIKELTNSSKTSKSFLNEDSNANTPEQIINRSKATDFDTGKNPVATSDKIINPNTPIKENTNPIIEKVNKPNSIPLPSLSMIFGFIPNMDNNEKLDFTLKTNEGIQKKHKSSNDGNNNGKDYDKNWKIGISIGTNISLNSFGENTDNPELNEILKESHSDEFGYSTAINISKSFAKKYHIRTGLEFYESQNQFNIIHISDSVMYRTSPDGQPELVPAIANRTVRHNNRFRHLSIPLEIGLSSKSFNNISIGIRGGIGLNYFLQQKGKSINANNEIQKIDNSTKANRAYNSIFISYHLSPFINYDLTEKMALGLNSILRYQNYGKSEFHGVKRSSFLLGVNLGMSYKF